MRLCKSKRVNEICKKVFIEHTSIQQGGEKCQTFFKEGNYSQPPCKKSCLTSSSFFKETNWCAGCDLCLKCGFLDGVSGVCVGAAVHLGLSSVHAASVCGSVPGPFSVLAMFLPINKFPANRFLCNCLSL